MEHGGETQNIIVENIEIDEEDEEVEEIPTLQRIHYMAACAIMLSAFMGIGTNLTAGNVSVSWNLSFMLLFGLLFAVLDAPSLSETSFIMVLEAVVGKHMHLISSVTGKGLSIAIMGCMLYNAMSLNKPSIVIRLLNTFIIFAGLATFWMGHQKTKMLSAARDAILAGSPPGYVESQLENVLQPYAHVYPISLGDQAGLTPDEFNALVTTIGHSEPLDQGDLKLIFKQLRRNKSSSAKGGKSTPPKLLIGDLQAWFENKSTTMLV